jgi:hypothetical protein
LTDAPALPLHTRALTFEARADRDRAIELRGEVLDLRKRSLMPVPGSLQLPGVIHRMELDARVDTAERRITALATRQPVVPFEASERTGGESCRDSAPALLALSGARLDDDFLRKLSAAYGGPRGCTHLLTLARLLAGTAARVLDGEAALGAPPRAAGERVFRRVLVIDGSELPGRRLELAAQMSDVHLRPAAEPAEGLLGTLASWTEARATALVDFATTTLHALRAEERTRTREALHVPFRDRTAELAGLVGSPLMAGFGPALVQRFAGARADAPLLDLLLNLAPGYIQCVAAVTDLFLPGGGRGDAGGLGARPDSCFMWRSGGALHRLVSALPPSH